MSIDSAAILRSFSLALSADILLVMASSISCLTLFASCPITGRSSAESFPICFRIAVSSPFLPRYLILSSSRAFMESLEDASAIAAFSIFSSCCFIKSPHKNIKYLSDYYIEQSVKDCTKKALP